MGNRIHLTGVMRHKGSAKTMAQIALLPLQWESLRMQ